MDKPQLFLLHFAGGNSYSFRFMEPYLKDFELIAPELPGRGRRIGENLLKNFDQAAHDIYNQIVNKLNSTSFLIYGHSLGAYLALKVTKLLEQSNKYPSYVIVGGNAGPGVDDEKDIYKLEEPVFIEELKKLGGIPKEFLENEELLEMFIPILRADFELANTNEMGEESAVSSPIYVMMGSQEEEVGEITNWAKFTRSSFDYEILDGDHFFIYKHAHKIAGIIENCYRKAVLS